MITTCSPRNAAYLKSFGADAAFDYVSILDLLPTYLSKPKPLTPPSTERPAVHRENSRVHVIKPNASDGLHRNPRDS